LQIPTSWSFQPAICFFINPKATPWAELNWPFGLFLSIGNPEDYLLYRTAKIDASLDRIMASEV